MKSQPRRREFGGAPTRFLALLAFLLALLVPGLGKSWPMAAAAAVHPVTAQGLLSGALVPNPGLVDCEFVLGFKMLRDAIPDEVGECLEDVHYDPVTGGGFQRTTGGLLVWREADNHTAFTDGYRTWVHGPYGVQQRLHTERFQWEAVQQLSNTEYRLPLVQESRIRLVDGEYASPSERVRAGLLRDLVAVGDLDGDGVADAVATLFLDTGGSGTFIYAIPLVDRNGVLVQAGREFLGDRVKVNSVTVSGDGVVTIDLITHGPTEPLCCPTQQAAQKFNVRILVESPTPYQEVTLPFKVAGKARTTEGNVRLRIQSGRRDVVVDTFTTARMDEIGRFGPFEFTISSPNLAQHKNAHILLELFEESAADGRLIGLITVPVYLR